MGLSFVESNSFPDQIGFMVTCPVAIRSRKGQKRLWCENDFSKPLRRKVGKPAERRLAQVPVRSDRAMRND
jgi:hypothetical protein